MRSGGLWVLLLLTACAKRTPSDVVAAFAQDQEVARATASTVLFVPGIMGSELLDRNTGERLWGDFGTGAANPSRRPEDFLKLALPLARDGQVSGAEDPDVVPGGELLSVSLAVGQLRLHARAYPGVFEGAILALEAGGGHARALPSEASIEGRSPLHAVGYDWRRSITDEAMWLHEDVVAASEARRKAGLDPRVDIVAHSMGTQLVRWYLRYGPHRMGPDGVEGGEDWDPSRWVRRALLVAPPTRGEAALFETLVHGERANPLVPRDDPALIATFPSVYEMLPRLEAARVVWSDDGTPVDLYDASLWSRFGWGPFHPRWEDHVALLLPEVSDPAARRVALERHLATCLAHARRVHQALDTPKDLRGVATHVFVGTDHPTHAILRVDRGTGALTWAPPVDGDGTVSRGSAEALGSASWTSVHFIRADHMGIVAHPEFLEQALYLLLEATAP